MKQQRQRRLRALGALVTTVCALSIMSGVPAHAGPGALAAIPIVAHDWQWPVPPPAQVVEAYRQPAHHYAPGHRGIDLAATDLVLAPAPGVIAFVGSVAGRELITIAHDGDLVTTLEPVSSELAAGTSVAAGDVVGRVTTGGHSAPGTVHFGVRLAGEYINPLSLLGEIPAAVLLPCCS